MTVNMGAIDRIVRFLVGAGLVAFALGYLFPGSAYSALGWLGVIPLLTALAGVCPLYSLFGISTCPAGRRA